MRAAPAASDLPPRARSASRMKTIGLAARKDPELPWTPMAEPQRLGKGRSSMEAPGRASPLPCPPEAPPAAGLADRPHDPRAAPLTGRAKRRGDPGGAAHLG